MADQLTLFKPGCAPHTTANPTGFKKLYVPLKVCSRNINSNSYHRHCRCLQSLLHFLRLEKLPRPVSELNCRQARTFLVKLLRAANGGMNPHYGNPESRPPFWPDYYWPWDRLFDVHTKPCSRNINLNHTIVIVAVFNNFYTFFSLIIIRSTEFHN